MAKTGPKTTVGVRLEERWIKLLDKLAAKQNKSRSDVARSALQLGLESLDGKKPEPVKEAAQDDGLMAELVELNKALVAKVDSLARQIKAAPRPSPVQQPQAKVVPPKKVQPAEKRDKLRAKEGGWATPRESSRSYSHFVTRDGAGILYFACGKHASAAEYRSAPRSARQCNKCRAELQKEVVVPEVIPATKPEPRPKPAPKKPQAERRSGPMDRRNNKRPLDSPGRRNYDKLEHFAKVKGIRTAASILGVSAETVSRAIKDPTTLNAAVWQRFIENETVKAVCAPIGGQRG